jgi:hypothetical protein
VKLCAIIIDIQANRIALRIIFAAMRDYHTISIGYFESKAVAF